MERDRTRTLDRDRDRMDREREDAESRDRDRDREERGGSRGLARRDYSGTSLWDPRLSPGFEAMRQMMREMTRPFGDFFGRSGSMMAMPPVEVFERDDRVVVRVELPGLRREDVKVRVVDDTLIIEGERRSDRDREQSRRQGLYESEFHYGRFSRRIVLPGRIDPSQVRARFQDGVLEVEATSETPTTREVPIETERETAETSGRGR